MSYDLNKISPSTDKNLSFGTKYKRQIFSPYPHKAFGQKHQQAMAKGGDEGSH
jgi:hypothetical protein